MGQNGEHGNSLVSENCLIQSQYSRDRAFVTNTLQPAFVTSVYSITSNCHVPAQTTSTWRYVRELGDAFVYLFSDEFKMTQEPVYKMKFDTLVPKMLSVFTVTLTFMVKIQVKGRRTA